MRSGVTVIRKTRAVVNRERNWQWCRCQGLSLAVWGTCAAGDLVTFMEEIRRGPKCRHTWETGWEETKYQQNQKNQKESLGQNQSSN